MIEYMKKYFVMRLFILSFILFSGGCSSLGPMTVKKERINYNAALQHTNDEQILMNLVRLKYRDTPIFLEISSINSRMSFEVSADAGAELEENAPDVFSIGGGVTYAIEPVVTYTPLQGEEFVQRLLTPISLDTLMLLYQSGWSMKRILRLCVQRLNDVENAPRASGPTPGTAPEYENFAHVLDLMGKLEQQRDLSFVYEVFPSEDRHPRAVMQISKKAWTRPEMQEIVRILNLAKNMKHYPLVYPTVEHEEEGKNDRLTLETRSVLGILYFLSESVEAPSKDVQEGKVKITRYDSGELFDWTLITGKLLQIKTQPSKPSQPSVAVYYRRSWFYINDSDLESKSTFSLLSQLIALQSGKTDRVLPLLTLPLGN
jgi:hypothetical protein